MSPKTKILIVEHDPHDLELLHHELKKGGINYVSETVQNEQDYINALKAFIPDIILSDYTFPSFNGSRAFKIKQKIAVNTPFIFISGTIGEEKSIDLIKNGVTDYVLKERLLSLPVKINRALKESREKLEKDTTSRALQNALNDLKKIMNSSLDVICSINEEGKFVNVSPASESVWGYQPHELQGKKYIDLVFNEDVYKTIRKATEIVGGMPVTFFENRNIHKNGSLVPVLWSATWDVNDKLMYCVAKDTTENQKLEKSFESERKRFHDLFLQAPTSMGILKGANHVFETANSLYQEMIGQKDIIGKTVKAVMPELEEQGFIDILDTVYKTGEPYTANEMLVQLKNKENGDFVDLYLNFIYQAYRNTENKIEGIFFFAVDVSEQVLSRKKIEESEKRYRQIVETAQEGIWLIDENNKTTFVNKKMADILEYTVEEMMGKLNYFFMDDEWEKKATEHIVSRKLGMSENHDFKYITKNGRDVWANISTNPVFDDEGIYKGALAMVTDITARKKGEQEMAWLINNTEESFILLSNNLEVISFNNQFQKLYARYFGVSVVKGTSILDYAGAGRRERVKQTYKRVLKGSEEYSELAIPLQDATVKNFAIKYKPAKDEQGKIIGAFVSTIDITEKKESEQQLIINEKRYRALVENGTDAVVILSMDGGFTYVSPSIERILGYSEEEIMKLDVFSLTHPDDIAGITKVWEQVMASPGIPLPGYISRMLHKNGSWHWLETTFTNMLHDAALNGIVDNFSDVTEKIKAEKLREFERRDKEALINTTTDLIWSVTRDFKLIAANQAFVRILKESTGFDLKTGDELLMKGQFPPEYLVFWEELYNKALEGESFIKEIYTPATVYAPGGENHTELWGEIKFNPIYDGDTITGIACYSRDITASKNYQNTLVGINKKLETAQQIAKLGYWELDINFNTLYWSNEIYNIWGVSPGTFEINLKNFRSTIYPDDREMFDEMQKKALDGKNKMDIEYRIINPSGKIKHVHEKAELVYNDGGKVIRFEGTVQDITERKELETLLNKASKLAKIGSWEVDLIKSTVYWSEITKEIHETEQDYVPHLATGINFYKEGANRGLITQRVQEAVEKGAPWDVELQIITAKGNAKWIRSIGEVENANGKCIRIYGSFQDITERKDSEILLRKMNEDLEKHAENLSISNAELEQFAYVASHDLQEPLRMITSFLTQFEKRYGNIIDDRGRKYIDFAIDGAMRMRQIILDLLEFSKVGKTGDSSENIDLNKLIHEIRILFRKQITEKKAVIVVDKLPHIYSHISPMRQVFQNLIGNALKYSGKDIRVHIHITVKELKDHWQFAIIDNGIGIEKEYFEKIFIIFQRLHNRNEYSGTGMGLAISKKIIETLGGKIWVQSEQGKGSTFYFTIKKIKDK